MKTRILSDTFIETKEVIEITFLGWDGTGYDGEGKKMKVWTCNNDDKKYVCKWMPCYKAWCVLVVTDEKHEKTNLPIVTFFADYESNRMRTTNI